MLLHSNGIQFFTWIHYKIHHVTCVGGLPELEKAVYTFMRHMRQTFLVHSSWQQNKTEVSFAKCSSHMRVACVTCNDVCTISSTSEQGNWHDLCPSGVISHGSCELHVCGRFLYSGGVTGPVGPVLTRPLFEVIM